MSLINLKDIDYRKLLSKGADVTLNSATGAPFFATVGANAAAG